MNKKILSASEIYITYKKLLHFEANSYLGNFGLEEDGVQETLIKLMKNAENLSRMDEEERYRYIRKTAKFTAIDVFNREIGKYKREESIEDIESIDIEDGFKTDDVIFGANIGDFVDDYIAGLSEIDREIINLVYGYDLNYSEISILLGIEEAAVRKRLSRARGRLKEAIEKDKKYEY